MSRHRQEELEFGSDAFLDVIANIVGILIILIVIAGVRVSQTPTRTADPALASLPLLAIPPSIVEPEEEPEPDRVRTVYRGAPPPPTGFTSGQLLTPSRRSHTSIQISPLTPSPRPEPIPVVEAPATLVSQAQALEADQLQLQAEKQRLLNEQVQLQITMAQAQSLVTSQRNDLDQRAANQAMQRRELLALNQELETTRAQLLKLRQNLNESSGEPDATVMEHRMTPVGRLVEGNELHFRLEGGRVTHVPIDALAAELGNQVQRQRSIILKTSAYQGTVGPVDGYIMEYRIERARASLEEELRVGSQMVRMSVSQWTLIPQAGLVGETGPQAMQRDSEFYRSILTSGPTTTLTFWTYPDSFALHRELQQFAQRHGYQVAARPLPTGVPIAGSPNGSKSLAQ